MADLLPSPLVTGSEATVRILKLEAACSTASSFFVPSLVSVGRSERPIRVITAHFSTHTFSTGFGVENQCQLPALS